MKVDKNTGNGTFAALYCDIFRKQSFANLLGSSGLPSPLWIQKQSNYRHSPYCPLCLQSVRPAREAKPRFGTTFERSAHDCETRLFSKEPRPPSVTSCSISMGQLTGSILSCKLQLARRCPLQLRVTWHFINTRHEKRYAKKAGLSNLRCAKDCGWRFARRRHWCVLTWR